MKYPISSPILPSESLNDNVLGINSYLPSVNNALIAWEGPIKLIKITTANTNGRPVVTSDTRITKATVQPLSPQELEIKTEGERSFEWLQIHIRLEHFTLNITTGDQVEWKNIKYTIMNDLGYGHKHFHVCSMINKNAI